MSWKRKAAQSSRDGDSSLSDWFTEKYWFKLVNVIVIILDLITALKLENTAGFNTAWGGAKWNMVCMNLPFKKKYKTNKTM